MKLLKNSKIILLGIILLASLLRLPLINQLPVGITIDEAGQAYSAYSILNTGKDEWGDFLPINPRGFGDYKPPVFMYLLVPSVAAFGLNEFAVRFPSAIAGILTVLIMYFLLKDLFKNSKIGLLGSFILAISPWHVYYSRLGWESNIGLMFFILGIWLFIKGMYKTKFLNFSMLNFGLAALSYHSFKLLVPLMFVSLIIIFWNEVKKLNKKTLILPISIIVLFSVIVGYGFIFSGASRRASDQSLAKEENLTELRQNQINDGLPVPLNKIFNNKPQFLISKITDNYLGYYSLSFLFGPHRSDGSILNFPSGGLLYIWQLPLIILGIWYLLKNKSKSSAVIFILILLAPIPASLTQDYMHAGRAQALYPALTILSVLGLYFISELVNNKKSKRILTAAIILIIFSSLLFRIDNYLFHTFDKPLGGLVQGYEEVFNYTEKNKNNYNKIIFTKTHAEPHAFLSFYAKLNPETVQSEAQNWKQFETNGLKFLDMMDYQLGKYEFKNVDFSRDRHEPNTLIITSEKEMPNLLKPLEVIKNSSDKIMFAIYDTNSLPD